MFSGKSLEKALADTLGVCGAINIIRYLPIKSHYEGRLSILANCSENFFTRQEINRAIYMSRIEYRFTGLLYRIFGFSLRQAIFNRLIALHNK